MIPSVAEDSADDSTLLAASRRGDVTAFGQLIERHHALVCAVAYSRTGDRVISEDIAQDTFLAAWRSLATLKDPDRLRAWLCGIARNLAGKTNRGRRRETLVDADTLDQGHGADPGPLQTLLTHETEATVWAALLRLPDVYREPLVLFYREEQSVRQVAEGLGLTEETAKQRLSRGRKALEQSLGELVGQTLAAGRPNRAARAAVVAAIVVAATAAPDALAATSAGAASTLGSGWKLAIGLGVLATVAGLLVWLAISLQRPATTSDRRPQQAAAAAVTAKDPQALLAQLRAAHEAWRAAGTTSDRCDLNGSVRRADGSPVAGALVGVMEHGWDATSLEPMILESDANGAWTVPVRDGGAYTISVSAPGQRARTRSVTCDRARTSSGAAFVLPSDGSALRGVLTDIGGGPIAGGTLWVLDALAPASGTLFITRSDAAGGYELRLAPGPYTVMVMHPDYTFDVRPVSIGASAAREDFTLIPGASIDGTVVDEAGQPVPGAIVSTVAPVMGADTPLRWQLSSAYGAMLPVVADATGKFRVRSLAPGNVRLTARSGGSATVEPIALDLTLAETRTDVALPIHSARTLSGFVVGRDDQRRGVDDVLVIAYREDAPLALPLRATTDGAGRFELRGLASGTYRLAARGPAYAPSVSEPIAISDRDRDDALVVLDRGVAVRGRIEPRGPATIIVQPAAAERTSVRVIEAALVRAEIAEDGTFTLPAVAPGNYIITARTAALEHAAPLRVSTGMTDVVALSLAPRPAIIGQVVDDTGAPVPRVVVVAVPPSGSDPAALMQSTARTDDHGNYAIVGLAAGRHQVRVFDARGQRPWARTAKRPFAPRAVDVPAVGARTERLEVASRSGRIAGVAVGPDQRPLADCWIEVRDAKAHQLPPFHQPAPVLTDAAGRFAIDGLFGTDLTVEASGPDGQQRALVAHVTAGAQVRLALRPLGTLIGAVTYRTAAVTDGAGVIRQPSTDWSRRVTMTGGLRIPKLIAGAYELTITSADGYAKLEVTVGTSPTTTADIELSPWASVRGTLRDSDGRPWAGAKILVEAMLEPARLETDTEGRFSIERIDGGHKSLTFVATADRVFSLDVDVTPGQSLDLGVVTARSPLDHQSTASSSPDLGLQFFVAAAAPTDTMLTEVARDPMVAYRGRTEPGAQLWIAGVDPKGPAGRAGLRRGDVVRAVGLRKIDDAASAADAMSSFSQRWRSRGREVPWTVIRSGVELRLQVLVPN